MIAQIAISSAVFAMDKPYDYLVPPQMQTQLQPGMRVMVPFGRANRRQEGMVLALDMTEKLGLKSIEQMLDKTPVLSEAFLRLAAFLRERYFCTFYDAVRVILPAGLWFATKQTYLLADPLPPSWQEMVARQPLAGEVMAAVLALGGKAEETALRQQFSDESALQKALRYLTGKKLLAAQEDFLHKSADKTEQMVCLAAEPADAMEYAARKRKTAPLQAAVLELLCTIGRGCMKEVCYFTGASPATVRRLAELGYLELQTEVILRRPEIQVTDSPRQIQLSDEQQAAYLGLRNQMQQEKPGTALLYGVTGSGKTAVYLKLIADCLAVGKSALLLVPEIALTPQLLNLFTAQFGDLVAVLHSSLRVGERYDEWKRVQSGAARLVIGTRSAVFAPAQNLGLILLDEEQEHTYKSENTPRYHAREVAIYRGVQAGALVVLGSATPSIETMYRAKTGVYRCYSIQQRYNGKALPRVQITDLKEEIRRGNGTVLGQALQTEMEKNFAAGHQTILFLNRRGSSRLLVCVDCGHVPECPRCSVSLTYHGANRRLMCHYCNYSEPLPARCPVCGGPLKQVGAGTQRVQEDLKRLWPEVRTLRMDADTISAAHPHEQILRQFQQEKIPVLIGTQMVAKGLNFENVTLVGVLDADQSLYVSHFRAAETTFSMLAQVIGRAGRGQTEGLAVIQTMTPEHPVIQLAAAQDYAAFYEMEIQLRQLRHCPPFADEIMITFHGASEEAVIESAVRFRTRLERQLQTKVYAQQQVQVLGPAPAPVVKVNNRYRHRLTLNCKNTRPLRELLAYLIREFTRDRKNRGVSAYADVNAYE